MTELVTSQPTFISALERRDDILAEFLRLQISPQTQRLYAGAIEHFLKSIAGESASPELIHQFLQLEQGQAISVVLKYKADLQEVGLASATINVKLAAIKSLVEHASKLQRCNFSLKQVKGVKSRAYRDTTGVSPEIYGEAIRSIDRSTVKGKRDYGGFGADEWRCEKGTKV